MSSGSISPIARMSARVNDTPRCWTPSRPLPFLGRVLGARRPDAGPELASRACPQRQPSARIAHRLEVVVVQRAGHDGLGDGGQLLAGPPGVGPHPAERLADADG